MQAYRVQKVHIGERHPLYGWCHQVTALANNLSNAVRFRQRQLLTASRKEEGEWTENEKEVIQEFRGYLGEEAVIPSSPGYKTIYNVLYATGNPDYFAKGLPKQSAQGVIQKCVQDMDSYFALMKRYQAGAGDRPSLPGYKRKGGIHPCMSPTRTVPSARMGREACWPACLLRKRPHCGSETLPDI